MWVEFVRRARALGLDHDRAPPGRRRTCSFPDSMGPLSSSSRSPYLSHLSARRGHSIPRASFSGAAPPRFHFGYGLRVQGRGGCRSSRSRGTARRGSSCPVEGWQRAIDVVYRIAVWVPGALPTPSPEVSASRTASAAAHASTRSSTSSPGHREGRVRSDVFSAVAQELLPHDRVRRRQPRRFRPLRCSSRREGVRQRTRNRRWAEHG